MRESRKRHDKVSVAARGAKLASLKIRGRGGKPPKGASRPDRVSLASAAMAPLGSSAAVKTKI